MWREQLGAAQRGQALLAGMLRCRRCGHKLVVHYTGSRHDVLRYHCRPAGLIMASHAASALRFGR